MNLREHLQFLAMLVPTLLLLAFVAATLAFPATGPGEALPPSGLMQVELGEGGKAVLREIAPGAESETPLHQAPSPVTVRADILIGGDNP